MRRGGRLNSFKPHDQWRARCKYCYGREVSRKNDGESEDEAKSDGGKKTIRDTKD